MPRPSEELIRRRALDHVARMHDDDAVGVFPGQRQIMSDQDRRHAGRRRKLGEQIHDHRLGRDIETGGRLIGDQQCWLAGERQCDRHTLAHPTGELERIGGARRTGSGIPTLASISIARCGACTRVTSACRPAGSD
jgi:hypothetical protein